MISKCITPTIRDSLKTWRRSLSLPRRLAQWLPQDADISASWDEQVQTAVECFNAGGSISFSPKTDEAKARWLNYDTRHMLAELDPKPEMVTVAVGTTQWDVISMMSKEDIKGTHWDDLKVQAAWSGMVVDATPAFYLEHLKRLRKHKIQPYFVPAHFHQLEIIERLVRAGVYTGPLNMALTGYGGRTLGRNPFDWMEMVRRAPQGAVADILDQHAGHDHVFRDSDCPRPSRSGRQRGQPLGREPERMTSVDQIKGAVRISQQFGRKVATAEEARKIMKVGVWYHTVEETLQDLGLPPSREGDNKGFLVWGTDGKKTLPVVASDSHPIANCMVPPEPILGAQEGSRASERTRDVGSLGSSSVVRKARSGAAKSCRASRGTLLRLECLERRDGPRV
jgi:hypothetical protein